MGLANEDRQQYKPVPQPLSEQELRRHISSPLPLPAPLAPAIGQEVRYILDKTDVEWIVGNRAVLAIAAGNPVKPGDICSARIVAVLPNGRVNLQVYPDGNDTLWVRNREGGNADGNWHRA